MNARQIKVDWTPEMIKDFRTQYKEAVDFEENTFDFQGQTFYTEYARILLDHLDQAK